MAAIERLLAIMARLRGPAGCPWDRDQDFASLRGYLLEEAYEVAEAIDSGDLGALREELGDLLLQIVFLSQLGDERGAFDFETVAATIADKLVRRHPHVFGEESAVDAEEAFRHWEQAKAAEDAGARRSRLDGVPRSLPALLRAQRLADRAARAGFDWPDAASVLGKVAEELDEMKRAVACGDGARIDEELGDLLFAAVSLARTMGVDSEGALGRANRKFERRFRAVERLAASEGRLLAELGPAELDDFWRQAKREE